MLRRGRGEGEEEEWIPGHGVSAVMFHVWDKGVRPPNAGSQRQTWRGKVEDLVEKVAAALADLPPLDAAPAASSYGKGKMKKPLVERRGDCDKEWGKVCDMVGEATGVGLSNEDTRAKTMGKTLARMMQHDPLTCEPALDHDDGWLRQKALASVRGAGQLLGAGISSSLPLGSGRETRRGGGGR